MAWTHLRLIIVPNLYDSVKKIGKQTVLETIDSKYLIMCSTEEKKSYRFVMI